MASLKELQREKKELNQQLYNLNLESCKIKNRLSDIDRSLATMTKNTITVSEHALIRLLERRYGQEEMLKQVVDTVSKEIAHAPKNCKLRIDGDLEAVIANGVLITVKPLN